MCPSLCHRGIDDDFEHVREPIKRARKSIEESENVIPFETRHYLWPLSFRFEEKIAGEKL